MTSSWTLMASHGTVLFYVALHKDATIRDIADAIELTERRVSQIVRDLARTDILSVERRGRQNVYEVNPDATFEAPGSRVPMSAVLRLLQQSSQEQGTQAS